MALAVGRKAVERGSDFACESVGRAIPVHLRPSCTPPGAREKQRERERERERKERKPERGREAEILSVLLRTSCLRSLRDPRRKPRRTFRLISIRRTGIT